MNTQLDTPLLIRPLYCIYVHHLINQSNRHNKNNTIVVENLLTATQRKSGDNQNFKSSKRQTSRESGMLEGKAVMHGEVVCLQNETGETQSQRSGLLHTGRPAKHN